MPGWWRTLRDRVTAERPRTAAVVCIVGALLVLGLTWRQSNENRRLDAGSVADARVREVVLERGRDARDHVTVEFVTSSGQRVVTDVKDFSQDPPPTVGGTLRVRYDPAEPTLTRDDRRSGDVTTVGVLSAVAAGFLALGVVLWPSGDEAEHSAG
jgi:hypothetical protein